MPLARSSSVHDVDPTARRSQNTVVVESPNLKYTSETLESKYTYHGTHVKRGLDGEVIARPFERNYEFKTQRKVPKTGLLLIGLGGNNGSTLVATVEANRNNVRWGTREGIQQANYYGSIVRASTVKLGTDDEGKDFYVPFSDVLPVVHPNDLVISGWDISSMPLDEAVERSAVLDYDLQQQVKPLLRDYVPMPSIYYPQFINANQGERADNLIPGHDKNAHVEHIRADIRSFKKKHKLDQVIVLWTANTERYADIVEGVNDTADNLLASIKESHAEVAPSTIFAVASILEGAPFINGAPQNTFVPGCIQLAEREQAFIGGDDFKSGQTKVKSVLAEYLVNAGIKPLSIASYNHLGNNDGRNLSAPEQFRSKEISKSSVVDDVVNSNDLLFGRDKASGEAEHPDHVIVIKYIPAVGDHKKALDEYNSEISMGGRNTLSLFNECQDSLLATPLILDLTILTELMTRVSYRTSPDSEYKSLYSILGLLSYMLKAPLTKKGYDVVNSLSRQRNALEVFLRACLSLQPTSDLINLSFAD